MLSEINSRVTQVASVAVQLARMEGEEGVVESTPPPLLVLLPEEVPEDRDKVGGWTCRGKQMAGHVSKYEGM